VATSTAAYSYGAEGTLTVGASVNPTGTLKASAATADTTLSGAKKTTTSSLGVGDVIASGAGMSRSSGGAQATARPVVEGMKRLGIIAAGVGIFL
jgi:hypothetical protein